MNYWLDLFTGTTWKEFRDAGATTSGFEEEMGKRVAKLKVDDVLLCYLTGVKRWVTVEALVGLLRAMAGEPVAAPNREIIAPFLKTENHEQIQK